MSLSALSNTSNTEITLSLTLLTCFQQDHVLLITYTRICIQDVRLTNRNYEYQLQDVFNVGNDRNLCALTCMYVLMYGNSYSCISIKHCSHCAETRNGTLSEAPRTKLDAHDASPKVQQADFEDLKQQEKEHFQRLHNLTWFCFPKL